MFADQVFNHVGLRRKYFFALLWIRPVKWAGPEIIFLATKFALVRSLLFTMVSVELFWKTRSHSRYYFNCQAFWFHLPAFSGSFITICPAASTQNGLTLAAINNAEAVGQQPQEPSDCRVAASKAFIATSFAPAGVLAGADQVRTWNYPRPEIFVQKRCDRPFQSLITGKRPWRAWFQSDNSFYRFIVRVY